MNSDLVARTKQALGAVKTTHDAKGKELLERAQAVIEAPAKQTLVAAPPPEPQVERVKVPMTCSASGTSYVVIAERRGDELRFVGHEIPPPGPGGAARLPERLSGRYHIAANGWACPLCRNTDAVWLCNCERMNGAMHCNGAAGGRYHCACGRVEAREFVSVEMIEVRGAAVAAATNMRSTSPRPAQQVQPQSKQVTYGRSR
jgi:hypothetical protein